MTVHIPRWAVWVGAVGLVIAAVVLAFVIGRSSDDENAAETPIGTVTEESAETETTEGSESAATTAEEQPVVQPAPCSKRAAREATLESGFDEAIINAGAVRQQIAGVEAAANTEIEFGGLGGYFISILECRDLTGDDIEEMIVAPVTGASGHVLQWAIFTPDAEGDWDLAFHREGAEAASIRVRGDTVVTRTPTYAEGEALCCPSGREITDFAFEDGEFEIVSPVTTERARLIELSDGVVTRVGKLAPQEDSPLDAYGAFGRPTSINRYSEELCDQIWANFGVVVHFVNLGAQNPCGAKGLVGSLDIVGTPGEQAGWHTSEGARVGMTKDEVSALYPDAREQRGELVLVERPSPYGDTGVTTTLSALIADGRVAALRLYVGAGGE